MNQKALFHESIEDALGAVVQALGHRGIPDVLDLSADRLRGAE